MNWLDQLHDAVQLANPLPLHLSVGWSWSRCSTSGGPPYYPNAFPWAPPGSSSPPVIKTALRHIYDTVDSVDVQVGQTNPTSILSRLDTAEYAYHEANYPSQEFFSLAYANNAPSGSACTSSHFYVFPPADPLCSTPSGELGVFTAFEEIEVAKPHARGGIHTLRKSYNTGIDPDWPHIPFAPSLSYFLCLLPSITVADVVEKKKRGRLRKFLRRTWSMLRSSKKLQQKREVLSMCQKLKSASRYARRMLALARGARAHDLAVFGQLRNYRIGIPALYRELCLTGKQ